MKKKSVGRQFAGALALSVLAINSAWAAEGDRSGNGGVGVVCRDPHGKILNAQMLDIFEGENMDQNPLQYSQSGLDVNTMIRLAALQMISNAQFTKDFQTELAKVKANIVILPSTDVGLTPTNDAFPALYKKGCAFEQVANYMNDGKIRVDREIYNQLDKLNRAALYVHEAVYALSRNRVGETNSIRSRKLTAQVMADNSDAGVIGELMTQLETPPTPPTPPETDWVGLLRNGTYVSDNSRYCDIRITTVNSTKLFATFVGNCHRSDSAKLYFNLGQRASWTSSGYCDTLLNQIEIIDSNTFVATSLRVDGSKCSSTVGITAVYHHQ